MAGTTNQEKQTVKFLKDFEKRSKAYAKKLKKGEIEIEEVDKSGEITSKTVKVDYISSVDVLPGYRLVKLNNRYGLVASDYAVAQKDNLLMASGKKPGIFSEKSADPLDVDETYETEDIYPVDDDLVRLFDKENQKFVYICTGNDRILDGSEPCPMTYKDRKTGKTKQCWWKLVDDAYCFLGYDKWVEAKQGCINLSYGNRKWGNRVNENGELTSIEHTDSRMYGDVVSGISDMVSDCRIEKILILYPEYFEFLDPKFFDSENAEQLENLIGICKEGVKRHIKDLPLAEATAYTDQVLGTIAKRIDDDRKRREVAKKVAEEQEEHAKEQAAINQNFSDTFDSLIKKASEVKNEERTKK